jgi:hypothetical protein
MMDIGIFFCTMGVQNISEVGPIPSSSTFPLGSIPNTAKLA